MELKIFQRKGEHKSEAKDIRRNGNIPAVIYAKGEKNRTIWLEGFAFNTLLRAIPKGRLSTTQLELLDEAGKKSRVIVKEIQYHPTTYRIVHMDFEELYDDVNVRVNIPIECTGIVDCVGIKLGGVLRQVIRQVKVRCLPKDIPSCFVINVAEMKERQLRRLSDIAFPEGVCPLADLHEVAVAIVKR